MDSHGADAWRVWMGREQRAGSVSQLTRHVVAAVLGPCTVLQQPAWLSVGDERLPPHHPATLLRPHDTLTLHLPTLRTTAPYLSNLPLLLSTVPDELKASIPLLSPTYIPDPVSVTMRKLASTSHPAPLSPLTLEPNRQVTPPALSKSPMPASSIAAEKCSAPVSIREVTTPELSKSSPPASSEAPKKFSSPVPYREVTPPALSKSPLPASSVAAEKCSTSAPFREVTPPVLSKCPLPATSVTAEMSSATAPFREVASPPLRQFPPPASTEAPEEFPALVRIIPHTSSQRNQTWTSSPSQSKATALTLKFEAPGSCSAPPAKRRRVRRRRRRTPVNGFGGEYGDIEESNVSQNEDGKYNLDPRCGPTPKSVLHLPVHGPTSKSVLHLPVPTFAPPLSIPPAPTLASNPASTFASSPAPTLSTSPASTLISSPAPTLALTASVTPPPTPIVTLGRVVRAL